MSVDRERMQVRQVQGAEPLHTRIGKLRDAARKELTNAGTPVRGEVDVFDAAVHVAAGTAGKPAAERRQALRDVQVGKTLRGAAHGRVTGKEQVAARTSTRAEKVARVEAWAKGLTQDQRDALIVSEKFERLTDRVQEVVSEVFAQIEDRAYEDSIGVQNYDFDAPTPDVDEIVGHDEDDADEAVDDSDFETMFEEAAWEAEQT